MLLARLEAADAALLRPDAPAVEASDAMEETMEAPLVMMEPATLVAWLMIESICAADTEASAATTMAWIFISLLE